MKSRFFAFALIGVTLLVGCGSSGSGNTTTGAGGSSPTGGGPTGGGGSTGGGTEQGHALHFTANLKQQSGELSFMTPSVSIIKVAASDIAGKPYMVASFPAGFSPGNDPPIDHFWGTVSSDLTIQYVTPKKYADGPYDMVLVIYVSTPITDAIKAAPAQNAPAARNGDLATFTADMTAVKDGDPGIPPGLVRLNVQGADADVAVENKVAVDPADITAALANTVMIIP